MKVVSEQSFIGVTEIPVPIQGSGLLVASVSGTHPNFSVTFSGTAASLFIAPGFFAIGLGPGILGSQLRIDYTIEVTLNSCSHTGTVGGNRDGYPSYMVFVNSKNVYDFAQKGPPNIGTIHLIPPMEVLVDASFSW